MLARRFIRSSGGIRQLSLLSWFGGAKSTPEKVESARKDFWKDQWEESKGEPRFHLGLVHPLLKKYLPDVYQTPEEMKGKTCLVPLCGKAKDLIYLSDQGFNTVGVEFVQDAIDQFAEEEKLKWKDDTPDVGSFNVFEVDSPDRNLKFLKGDFFQFVKDYDGHIDFAFDRASLVAIEPSRRKEYAEIIKEKCDNVILLVFDYNQSKMEGPPYSVHLGQVQSLFGDVFDIKILEVVNRTGVAFPDQLSMIEEWAFQLTRKS